MTDDRSLERAARSWLEIGPTQAPDAPSSRPSLRIQTTTQDRDLRVPWRLPAMFTPARLARGRRPRRPAARRPHRRWRRRPNQPGRPDRLAVAVGCGICDRDHRVARLLRSPGPVLTEHLGNAIDLSEMPTTDYHPERRRLYFLDPATMTGDTAVEFLPGQPVDGKLNADVSTDGKQVTFMDTADPANVWVANIDGSGLRKVSDCQGCSELDPAFVQRGRRLRSSISRGRGDSRKAARTAESICGAALASRGSASATSRPARSRSSISRAVTAQTRSRSSRHGPRTGRRSCSIARRGRPRGRSSRGAVCSRSSTSGAGRFGLCP